jgi:hypothetical protein
VNQKPIPPDSDPRELKTPSPSYRLNVFPIQLPPNLRSPKKGEPPRSAIFFTNIFGEQEN